ncbi:MAG: TRAP transporter substrate-binding protein [Sulfitobacter dubius]
MINFKMKGVLASIACTVNLLASTAVAQDVTIRLGGTGAVDSADYLAIEAFKNSVEERSDGRIAVQIFPNSQLGTYQEMLEQIKAGSLTGMYESLGIIGTWHPVAGLEAVPYLYRDVDHFFAVWNGQTGADILADVAENSGFHVVGPAFRGFRQMALNEPVETVEDLVGIKFRAPAIPAYMAAFQALGGSPTPIAFEEVYTAVQQDIVDGLENPIVTIADHRFYEVTKYLVMTNHMAETMGFIFSEEWFAKLPADLQEDVSQASIDSAVWYREYTAENEGRTIERLQSEGMTVIVPDLSGFMEKAAAFDPGLELQEWVRQIRAVQ